MRPRSPSAAAATRCTSRSSWKQARSFPRPCGSCCTPTSTDCPRRRATWWSWSRALRPCYDDLVSRSRRSAHEVYDAMAEAHQRHLLTTSAPDRLRLRHALLGEAARVDLDPGRRRALHRAWGSASRGRRRRSTPTRRWRWHATAQRPATPPQRSRQHSTERRRLRPSTCTMLRATLLTRVLDLSATGQVDLPSMRQRSCGRPLRRPTWPGSRGQWICWTRPSAASTPGNVYLLVELLVVVLLAEGRRGNPETPALERALHALPAEGHDRARDGCWPSGRTTRSPTSAPTRRGPRQRRPCGLLALPATWRPRPWP